MQKNMCSCINFQINTLLLAMIIVINITTSWVVVHFWLVVIHIKLYPPLWYISSLSTGCQLYGAPLYKDDHVVIKFQLSLSTKKCNHHKNSIFIVCHQIFSMSSLSELILRLYLNRKCFLWNFHHSNKLEANMLHLQR